MWPATATAACHEACLLVAAWSQARSSQGLLGAHRLCTSNATGRCLALHQLGSYPTAPARAAGAMLRRAACALAPRLQGSGTYGIASISCAQNTFAASSAPSAPPSRSIVSSISAAADASQPDSYNVPLGHLGSDLSSTACNIGLNRRRDLSLRQDLSLTSMEGEKMGLPQWLKGKNVVVFGIPNGGAVCVGEHIPAYDKLAVRARGGSLMVMTSLVCASTGGSLQAGELKKCDIDMVLCVMVGQPSEVKEVAAKAGASVLTFAADTNGGFTRLLGLDLAAPDAEGPRSQRYAGIIENGILTKLKVESNIAEVSVSGCERILHLLQCKRDEKLKYASA